MIFDYVKCPLHKYTFSVSPIREWVEGQCEGRVLNLFAGKTLLNVDEVRNDIDETMDAEYHKDAYLFVKEWQSGKFNTLILDPPYSYRKSMEFYNGHKASPFRKMKDEIPRVLEKGGKVITFGYHSVSMGITRGFEVERICLFSHGGAIHDTIATVERMV